VHTIPRLDRAARRRLIHRGRKTRDPHTALRFLMIAKLGQGLSRQQVARDLACVPSTVVKAARRFTEAGEEGLLDQRAFNGFPKVDAHFKEELERVLLSVPTEFGWLRTNWTRELLGRELERRGLPRVAACTMGRALFAIGARLGMPKPTVACPWDSARRKRVVAKLRRLARNATVEEPVLYEDEVDVHLNPKIGRDWMPRGHRRYVVTPGQNKKRFVAGALNATTRKLTWVDAPSKASELFHKLVWKLLGEYRHARRIHFILDNYIIHSSKRTKRFLAQFGDRVVLHFLPPYCPDDNRIERVWLDLHANVTRNHRCRTMEELMVQVVAFLRAYNQRKKLNPSLKIAAGVSGSRSVV
jgi:transposase